MAVAVTHAKTSAKSDGPDTTLVQPSDWNAAHTVPVASQAEAEAVTIDTKLMTPQRTGQAVLGMLASQAEAEAGTSNVKGMSPLRTKQLAYALFVPAGTKMLFQQTAAPTGWTKDTTHNDKALRVVSGTASSGGSIDFSTFLARTATDGHALTSGENGPHTHLVSIYNGLVEVGSTGGGAVVPGNPGSVTSGSSGSGTAHTHPIDCRIKYVDLIIATKN